MENGIYSEWTAVNDLTWILIDYDKLDAALTLAKRGEAQFPESRFFLWPLAEVYFKSGAYSESIGIYQRILNSLSEAPHNNHYNEVVCHLHIAEAYFATQRYEVAASHCRSLLQLPLDDEVRTRAKKKIKRALKLQEECDKKTAQLR